MATLGNALRLAYVHRSLATKALFLVMLGSAWSHVALPNTPYYVALDLWIMAHVMTVAHVIRRQLQVRRAGLAAYVVSPNWVALLPLTDTQLDKFIQGLAAVESKPGLHISSIDISEDP